MGGCFNVILHSHASGVDGNHRKMKAIFHKVCRKMLKKVGTKYATCSDLAAEWMFPNIDRSQLVHINNGIDLNKFKFNVDTREEVRKILGVKDEIVIGHVGRFAYQKNHEYLIGVVKKIRQRGLKTKLLLVGEGELENEFKLCVQKEGLQEDVIFYGVSHSVDRVFQAMDIFVLPSRFEGFPLVGVEAQASGLPVIFSNRITREAKISENVVFLPIDDDSVQKWAETIETFSFEKVSREDGYTILRNKMFDIKDTVKSFLSLYQETNS